jgi:hypothetical protein
MNRTTTTAYPSDQSHQGDHPTDRAPDDWTHVSPGTIGTVGTMVPRGGGGRVRRGPHDHLEVIIYMSRAIPRKTKGTDDWLGPGRVGVRFRPPPRPPGPWSRRSRWSRRRRRASQAASRPVSSFRRRAFACHAGHSPRGRDHVGEWSRRSDDEGSGPLAKRGGGATVRTWFGPRPQARSALVRRRLRLNRLWSSPLATPARRIQPWLHAGAPSRLSDPLRGPRGTLGGKCDPGNNCSRCLGVFSFRF